MTIPELDIAPRTKGRAVKPVRLEAVGELRESDLALLASEREIKPPLIQRLGDRHHALARCLASGMSDAETSLATGYDLSRISILRRDPTFAGLVEDYRSVCAGAVADFLERTTVLTLTAVNTLQEKLESEEDPVSTSMALEIAKFGADRIGHAPVARSLNVNVNADLGEKLRQARERVVQAERLRLTGT